MRPKSGKIRQWLRVSWFILLLALVNGCWDQRDLERIAIVLALGIDLKENNLYQTTFQVIKPSEMAGGRAGGGSGRGGGAGEAAVIIESQGVTVFDAIRNVALCKSRRINFTHNRIVVIGKKAAEHGIIPVLDLMIRDAEPRPTQYILVTPGEAVDVLKVKPVLEKVIGLEIENYLLNYGTTSKVNPLILQDVTEILLSKTTALTLPIIRVAKSGSPDYLQVGGQAVFKGDKWIYDLNNKETRGLMWVLGKVRSGIIVLSTPGKGKVSMEIVRASSKIEPEITVKGLKIKVKVRLDTNLGSIMNEQKSLVTIAGLARLGQKVEGYVKNEIKLAINRAQQLKTDIFGFGSAVYRKYPREWREMEPVWNEMFSELDVAIQVQANVRLIGKISKPL